MSDNNRDDLLETRKQYINNQYDQGKLFDNCIFLVSSGIFGISFTFMTTVIKNPIDNTYRFLLVSWYFFLLSIVCSLVGYIINYYAYKESIKIIDKMLEGKEYKDNSITLGSELLNIINILLLILGLVFIFIYIFLNLSGG